MKRFFHRQGAKFAKSNRWRKPSSIIERRTSNVEMKRNKDEEFHSQKAAFFSASLGDLCALAVQFLPSGQTFSMRVFPE